MLVYANVHAVLEERRRLAAAGDAAQAAGPRVVIAGPTDAGKSTLTRILLNYAVRRGRKPLFLDLDVGQGDITVPGWCVTKRYR